MEEVVVCDVDVFLFKTAIGLSHVLSFHGTDVIRR